MSLLRRFGARPRIGLALGARAAAARLLGTAARPERVELPASARSGGRGGGGSAGPSGVDAVTLTEALEGLAADLERTHGRDLEGADLFVALLPPWVDVRMIDLPPLKPEEAEAVVRRDHARHFLGGEGSRVVGVREDRPAPIGDEASGPPPAFAAAAQSALLDALVEAATSVGWRLQSIAPAHAAWLRAGLEVADGERTTASVVAVSAGTAHVLQVRGGAPVSLRRVDPDAIGEVDAVRAGSPVAVVGDGEGVAAVVRRLDGAGVPVLRGRAEDDALALAARFSEKARPRLVPPALEARLRERGREQLVRRIGAAALLLLLAVGLHYLSLRRELASIQDERAALRPEVAPLVAARDSLYRLNEEVTAIGDVAGRSHGWTRALAEVAYLLPRETYLTSLTGNEGLLEFEAAGQRAGEALEALRAATTLYDVRLVGLVERELENGETVVERFRLSARLEPQLEGEAP